MSSPKEKAAARRAKIMARADGGNNSVKWVAEDGLLESPTYQISNSNSPMSAGAPASASTLEHDGAETEAEAEANVDQTTVHVPVPIPSVTVAAGAVTTLNAHAAGAVSADAIDKATFTCRKSDIKSVLDIEGAFLVENLDRDAFMQQLSMSMYMSIANTDNSDVKEELQKLSQLFSLPVSLLIDIFSRLNFHDIVRLVDFIMLPNEKLKVLWLSIRGMLRCVDMDNRR